MTLVVAALAIASATSPGSTPLAVFSANAANGSPAHLPVFGQFGRDRLAVASELGANVAGLDDYDPDPEWPNLVIEGLAQAFECMLARRIVGEKGSRQQPEDRPDVDDPPAALSAHDRQHRPHHTGGSKDVGLEQCPEVRLAGFFDCAGKRVAGVVDQHIDAPRRSLNLHRSRNWSNPAIEQAGRREAPERG